MVRNSVNGSMGRCTLAADSDELIYRYTREMRRCNQVICRIQRERRRRIIAEIDAKLREWHIYNTVRLTGLGKGLGPSFFLSERRQWNMDVNAVTDLVSNVAFPIAAFVMMYYSNTKTIEELRKTIEENSLIMAKLSEKLDNSNDNKEG